MRHSLPHLSSRRIRGLIDEGGCTVNGRRTPKGGILFPGDRVVFCGDSRYLAEKPIARASQLAILFEDDALIAVDKPSGMATHGHSGKDDDTLANHLLGLRPRLAGIGRSRWEPGLLHRLDRDTSGIVLAAKQQAVFADVRRQFEQRSAGKFYRAVVCGRAPAQGELDYPLMHDPADRRKMCPCPRQETAVRRTWPAVTRFRTLHRTEGYSHVEVHIVTGVTHQIRAHMRAIGHPVAGDPLYGAGDDSFGRCMLHASRLELVHPVQGTRIVIQSPLPEEFDRVETAPRSEFSGVCGPC